MNPPLRLSVAMPPMKDLRTWRDQIRQIENLGLDAVSISDHFTQGFQMEPIVAMTAAAEATSTLRVQSLVLGNDYRHPVMLHKAMATLDVLSGGRVDIGLGAGWMSSDYEAAGISLDPPSVRISRLAEAAQVLRRLFVEDQVDFDGEHYQIRGLKGLPAPTRPGGPPLLIGGGSRAVLRCAGRWANIVGVNPSLRNGTDAAQRVSDMSWERIQEKIGWAEDAAAGEAREYQISMLSVQITDMPQSRSSVSSLIAAVDADLLTSCPAVMHGSVGACVEHLHEIYERTGITHFNLGSDLVSAGALAHRLR